MTASGRRRANLRIAKENSTFLDPGSGKTTALMMLAGFEPARRRYPARGRSLRHVRRFAATSASYSELRCSCMSVADNIAFHSVRGISKKR
jgi:ABC-type Fe3+/spermidine/putrescine transport system ATPase subunit